MYYSEIKIAYDNFEKINLEYFYNYLNYENIDDAAFYSLCDLHNLYILSSFADEEFNIKFDDDIILDFLKKYLKTDHEDGYFIGCEDKLNKFFSKNSDVFEKISRSLKTIYKYNFDDRSNDRIASIDQIKDELKTFYVDIIDEYDCLDDISNELSTIKNIKGLYKHLGDDLYYRGFDDMKFIADLDIVKLYNNCKEIKEFLDNLK